MASYEKHPDPIVEEKPKRSGLKTVLAIAIVILIVVAAAAGVLVWRNSTLSDAHQTDTEALNQSTAGVDDTTFQAIKLKGIPAYSKLYGEPLSKIKKIKGSKLTFASGNPGKCSNVSSNIDKTVAKKVKYSSKASLEGASGVSATIYFDKKKKAVALEYAFDLDALGVPEADFAVFANSRMVPSSLMMDIGFSAEKTSDTALSTDVDATATSESSNLRTATYTGDTGAQLKTVTKTKKVYDKKKKKKVKKKHKIQVQVDFMSWQLQQAYRYSASGTTRTTTIAMW